ncbi:uncharacterized protein SPSC_00062 [Sporisorium scitamineum]|uniref:YDG domain-containing protein n=2 Tax=Sporisorium scitamineum TaxID=49012 RepID=A0A127Z5D8_9BASI|nr:uncharacterized protein SPSC_00062 [Sporisorium scitamineum]
MVRRDHVDAQEDAQDYEAQRQANIKANLELMNSLGLYQGSKALNPRPSPSASKTKAKSEASSPGTSSAAGDAEFTTASVAVQRPRRITRSVSRTLDSPKKLCGRGMKRALSDEAYPSLKISRLEADKDSFSSDDDSSPSSRTFHRTGRGTLNPSRHYRPTTELQRQADRLGTRIHNPKTFGHIPGIPIGTPWEKRMDCSTDAVHAPTVAGISGNELDGCWSICLSGGYEDDIDLGDSFTYTGSGGRDLKGTVNNPKNLRTAPQSSDQRWEGKNAALRRSVETKKPVRVVRGWKAGGRYAPREGYVYAGLYRVTRAWMEKGAAGWLVCKFQFVRLAGQAALPTFDHEQDKDEDENEEEVKTTSPPSTHATRSTATNTPIDLTSPSPSPSSPLPHPHLPTPNPFISALRPHLLHHPLRLRGAGRRGIPSGTNTIAVGSRSAYGGKIGGESDEKCEAKEEFESDGDDGDEEYEE